MEYHILTEMSETLSENSERRVALVYRTAMGIKPTDLRGTIAYDPKGNCWSKIKETPETLEQWLSGMEPGKLC